MQLYSKDLSNRYTIGTVQEPELETHSWILSETVDNFGRTVTGNLDAFLAAKHFIGAAASLHWE